MEFCFLRLRPHSTYLLLLAVSAATVAFMGLPFAIDDRKIFRPKAILALEYFILLAVLAFEVASLAAFVHHAFDRNIRSRPAQLYLRTIQVFAAGGAALNLLLYILLAATTKRLSAMHLAVWGTRLALVLALLGILFLKSSELLNVKLSEVRKYLEEDEICVTDKSVPAMPDAVTSAPEEDRAEDEEAAEEAEEEGSGEAEEDEEEECEEDGQADAEPPVPVNVIG